MGGFDEHAIIGDWMPPSPSPRTLFSGILGDDLGSRSQSEQTKDDTNNNTNGFTFPGPDRPFGSENGDGSQTMDQSTKAGSFGDPKSSSRSGLVERMAARAGYNAPRLNTDIVRPEISQKLESQSSYLTISPGFSPTSFLESPVFLSNSQVQPSPTTGKFPFAPNGNGNGNGTSSMMFSDSSDKNKDKDNLYEDFNPSSFAFKPVPESAPVSVGPVNPPFMSWQSFQQENRFPPQSIETNKTEVNNFTSQIGSYGATNGNTEQSRVVEERREEDAEQIVNGENTNVNGGTSEDGYNWRKYGQKQVKGSEYPRSYYKCTHPNCPVKKKVERSHEGHITEIIYKGAHNHLKPPPSRRSGIGSSGVDNDPEWGHDGNLEVTSSTVVHHTQNGDSVDASSTFSNEEEEDDRATHGSVSLGYDGEGDESESKRRKVEAYTADVSGATRAIREPRVVVQTTSEVDILDDGYRWRKYGQKVVKGNPNPRSYYKCTSTGCTVRKHVERASHDLKSVITTYEGKHNHDVPAARNSSHVNSSTMGSQAQMHRAEPPQIPNNMARFERPGYAPSGYAYGMNMNMNMNIQGSGVGQMGMGPMGMGGFGPNQGKMGVHQYMNMGQARQMNEMGMMLPKGEPKVEPVSDPGLNVANGSYHQMMNRMPLGPQM